MLTNPPKVAANQLANGLGVTMPAAQPGAAEVHNTHKHTSHIMLTQTHTNVTQAEWTLFHPLGSGKRYSTGGITLEKDTTDSDLTAQWSDSIGGRAPDSTPTNTPITMFDATHHLHLPQHAQEEKLTLDHDMQAMLEEAEAKLEEAMKEEKRARLRRMTADLHARTQAIIEGIAREDKVLAEKLIEDQERRPPRESSPRCATSLTSTTSTPTKNPKTSGGSDK